MLIPHQQERDNQLTCGWGVMFSSSVSVSDPFIAKQTVFQISSQCIGFCGGFANSVSTFEMCEWTMRFVSCCQIIIMRRTLFMTKTKQSVLLIDPGWQRSGSWNGRFFILLFFIPPVSFHKPPNGFDSFSVGQFRACAVSLYANGVPVWVHTVAFSTCPVLS